MTTRARLVRNIVVQAARLIETGRAVGIAAALLSARLLGGTLSFID